MTNQPMYIKDCSVIEIATGERARNLSEMRDRIASCPLSTIYFHLWCGRLRPQFESQRFSNDFSMWAYKAIHDSVLSERLDVIDPTSFASLEEVRWEMVEILDVRLDEVDFVPSANRVDTFHFVRSNIVIYNTHRLLKEPKDLKTTLPKLSYNSIFYHLIDARRRTPDNKDDITNWLQGFGKEYEPLLHQLYNLDPYFVSLGELQSRIVSILEDFFHE